VPLDITRRYESLNLVVFDNSIVVVLKLLSGIHLGVSLKKKIEFLEKKGRQVGSLWSLGVSEALGAWNSWVLGKPGVGGGGTPNPFLSNKKIM